MSLLSDLLNEADLYSIRKLNAEQVSQAGTLDDAIPALLLPFRMETRFHQKEYELVYVVPIIPDLPGDGGILDPIGGGVDINPGHDRELPIEETPRASIQVVTTLSDTNASILFSSGRPIPTITGESLLSGVAPILDNVLVNLNDLVLVSPAAKNALETAAMRLFSTSELLMQRAASNKDKADEIKQAIADAFDALLGNWITLAEVEQSLQENLALEVTQAGVAIQALKSGLTTYLVHLRALNNQVVDVAAFLDALVALDNELIALINIAISIGQITAADLADIQEQMQAIADEQPSLQPIVDQSNAALQEFSDSMQTLREEATTINDIANDHWEIVSELPVHNDIIDLPTFIVYTYNETRWELLVRLYPDEIAIDTHEPELTDDEYRDGRLFWEVIWFDPANEEKGLEAWRPVVENYGRERAAWIVKATTPTNIEIDLSLFDLPANIADLIPPDLFDLGALDAGKTYWDTIWNGNGSPEVYEEAWTTLNETYPSPVSNVVAYATMPVNINDRSLQKITNFALFDNVLMSSFLPPQYPTDREIEDRIRDVFTWQKVPGNTAEPVFPPQNRRDSTWQKAPETYVLPDRFSIITQHETEGRLQYTGNSISKEQPLQAGMNPRYGETGDPNDPNYIGADILDDPASDEDWYNEEAFIEETAPQTDPGILWMTDFDEAENIGMGIRINLGTEEPHGFEKVFALGLRADEANAAAKGKELIEQLFNGHHYTGFGMSLLPQGVPTNNTEEEDAMFNKKDEGHAFSYRTELTGPLYTPKNERTNRSDGQWLADSLGIAYQTTYNLDYADAYDIANAVAMNQALAPATLASYMEQMMGGVFLPKDSATATMQNLNEVRDYFTNYVSGRGFLPAIRVGKQPYGILPTTAWSQWAIANNENQAYQNFVPIINKFGTWWDDMYKQFVEQVDKPIVVTGIDKDLDPIAYADKELEIGQARFMNILGLNPASVEWYRRMGLAESSTGASLTQLLGAAGFGNVDSSDIALLTEQLGLNDAQVRTNLLNTTTWIDQIQKLKGVMVQKGTLSEFDPLKPFLTDLNYIQVLLDSSLPAIRSEEYHKVLDPDIVNYQYPNTLLYLYLRHGLLQQYFDSAMTLLDTIAVDSDNLYGTKLRKTIDIFNSTTSTPSSSVTTQWDYLLKPFSEYPLKGSYDFSAYSNLADYLKKNFNTTELETEKNHIREVRRAMEILSQVPTAKLKRDFLEHIDLCTYRFDAWQQGMVQQRLEKQREANRSGIYLGGFSWVENLSPDNSLERVPENEIPDMLTDEDQELYRDPKNQGLMLAPSNNHGVAAAVLRNAYVSHYDGNSDSKVAVNLSSERIRMARQVIEGVQRGQSLGALLGYRFERYLHDTSATQTAELDKYVYTLRVAHPLTSVNIKEETESEQAINETIGANNVVDGLALYELMKKGGTDYTTWLEQFIDKDENDVVLADNRTHIEKAVDLLANVIDAISDVAMSEAVFHSVNGNPERANAFLSALSKNGLMPIPEAFETPRTGTTITHQLGLMFNPVNEDTTTVLASEEGSRRSPRSLGEPSLDQWLSGVLPSPDNIRFTAFIGEDKTPEVWTAEMLYLYAIDLFYLIKPGLQDNEGDFASYIRHLIRMEKGLDESVPVSLDFNAIAELPGEATNITMVSFYHVASLMEKVREVMGNGKFMTQEDFVLENSDNTGAPILFNEVSSRTSGGLIEEAFISNNPKGYNVEQLADRVKLLIDGQYYQLVDNTGGNNLLLGPAEENILIPIPFLTPPTGQIPFRGLGVAINEIKPLLVFPSGVTEPGKIAFNAARLKQLLLLIWKFGFDFAMPGALPDNDADRLKTLIAQAKVVVAELEPKVNQARNLTQYTSEYSADLIYDNLMQAISLITTGKFKMFPLFRLQNQQEVSQGASTTKVYNPNNTGATSDNTNYQELVMRDWLSDLSRMRKPTALLDEMLLFAENINNQTSVNKLVPLQYPATESNNYWIGWEFPEEATPKEEVKSMVFYGNVPTGQDWCGMLLDEWTEVIPSKEEDIAATFHYNQPNAKAPNAMLLAVTPQETGSWNWNHLVDTLDETMEMAKKRAVEPEHIEQYKKNGKSLFPKLFPTIASPILEEERGFSLDIADVEDVRLYQRVPILADAGVTVSASPSLLDDEDRGNTGGGTNGYAVNVGPTSFE